VPARRSLVEVELRHGLVGGDGQRFDLDQVVVEQGDQDAGIEVVRGGPFR
jgi:hypothetical protein